MKPVAVLGAGSWGTAIAWQFAAAGGEVRLWGRRADQMEAIRTSRKNPDHLPETELPPSVMATTSLEEVAADAEILVMAVPSHGFRGVCRDLAPHVSAGSVVVSAAKGIEEGSLARMSQVIQEELPACVAGVLSGPSFAYEVVTGHPTAVVIASGDLSAAGRVRDRMAGPSFRVYTLEDVAGVEVGGAYKNVVAIAAGVVDGLGYGTNTMAALITRGLREISRLAVVMGGSGRTLSGLAGLGDLVLTCMGSLSRNKKVGSRLAGGESLEEILASSSQVAEGVITTRSIRSLARRHGVETPIAETVEQVLYEGRKPEDAVRELMTRASKGEFE